jgi:membrane fusion protein, copper/silver efflux system
MSSSSGKVVTVIKVAFARARFLAVFVVAALVVGYWDDIKNHVDKWTRPAVAPDSLAKTRAGEIEYFCPMHPKVVREAPGNCPVCGMPLVKRKKGEAIVLPADVIARVQLTPRRMALANVQTSVVESKPLYRQINAVGVLDYDETKLARISARVAGRADELFVTYTGQSIKRGDPLYSLYSPEVYTALREYLSARKRVNDLGTSGPSETRMDAAAVYNAALQKLALWGVTSEQLDQLDQQFDASGAVPTNLTIDSPINGIVVNKSISQGQYLSVGEAPYSVADMSKLWLQVKLYERDIPLVQIGDAVNVTVDAFPSRTFDGVVAFKAFALDPQTRTLDARVVVDNAELELRPGMFATSVIRVPVNRGVGVSPASSQQSTGETSMPRVYFEGLAPYLEAHKRLSSDSAQGVPDLLRAVVKKLEPMNASTETAPAYQRLSKAVKDIPNDSIDSIRESWKEISAAMIEMGKSVGVPSNEAPVRVFKCPMKHASWLQLGDQTANPYYGASMLTCGSAIESLPKVDTSAPTTRRVPTARPTLAIPRSAVIDTGNEQIAYVESSLGIFDAKALKLGPLAGDEYPVLDGLAENDKVVTVGAFLIDAESRINPIQIQHGEHGEAD